MMTNYVVSYVSWHAHYRLPILNANEESAPKGIVSVCTPTALSLFLFATEKHNIGKKYPRLVIAFKYLGIAMCETIFTFHVQGASYDRDGH